MFKPCLFFFFARDSHRLLLKASEFKTKRAVERIRFSSLFSSLALVLSNTRARDALKRRERESKRERTSDRYYARGLSQAHSVRL